MAEILRVGIIGFGLSGSAFHAPVITGTEGLKLTAIHSKQKEKVLQIYPHVIVYETAEKLIHSDEVDVVVITSPNDTHYPLARAALLCNKHVVVEKPFVIHSKDGYELGKLAEQQKRVLAVYQNRRWDSDFLTLKSLIETNQIGDVHTFESNFDRYRPITQNRWREQDIEGSGVLYDLLSHLIDQVLVLFGKPDFVWADLQKQRSSTGAVDYAYVVLGYKSRNPELRAHLRAGCLFADAGLRFSVHGTKGSFIKHGVDPQEDALRRGVVPASAAWAVEPEAMWGRLTSMHAPLEIRGTVRSIPGDYRAFYRAFRSAALTGHQSPVSAEQAANVIRIIELATQSAQSGAAVSVELGP
eukprot:TRINITY_DN2058_c0_g2_i1.p1 TRINITY_DN2058_c0_g2~~TRINITY_DN2058_c0_g2_i1.p1  ORF type:complete len:356 (-),score=70.66 TRINITY_DN2058_c0_g2_i1:183-1250(-)